MLLKMATVTKLTSTVAGILEKAATDNGFELEIPMADGWLAFGSTSAPMQVWLTQNEGQPHVAFSRLDVANTLDSDCMPSDISMPKGAVAARRVVDHAALHGLLRRAWQLSRSLPDEPLLKFQQQTANLPRSTEAEQLVIQRVGQNLYRDRLLEYWQGRCAVTGLAVPSLLRASHIKPWADCASDAERLDVFNGLLLAPHLDAAFDCGLITLLDDGVVAVAAQLDDRARALVGLDRPLRVDCLVARHRAYLPWHRQRVFKG